MPRRADSVLDKNVDAQFSGAGTQWIIQTPAGVLYAVYVDTNNDVDFKKSTDGGLTWGNAVSVFGGTVTSLAVWYDRWSNIAAGLIHIAYQESTTDDTLYRTINTESADALSTQATILLGASTLAGGCLSISRARGGNVYCATMIDAGSEGGYFRLPNANVPNGAWDAARATVFEAATQDQIILLPGWAADNQDMMAIFWDSDADELSRKLYDDSANSWSEASISTGMVDQAAATAFPHFDAFVDIENSRNVVVAWNAVDLVNADLLGWTVTESAITAFTTPVVLNSTDDQGLCAITKDTVTGHWYCFYAGKSDGSETFPTSVNVYYKVSTDEGATWGPETLLTNALSNIHWLIAVPRWAGKFLVAFMSSVGFIRLMVSAQIVQPRASHQLFGG